MSYRALARQWRPNSFSELVGQQPIVQALTNALAQNRLHHAYLFTGTRGVGKTTIARILAKCLNCEQGVQAIPCGICQSCVDISQGCFQDLIEVDAASRTKVEDTRDLLDNVTYLPSRGRYKIYLIDEVHMLSNHSFNALLKTLEEPPSHVVFLLATTDPEKLPVTILSRCLQFHLRRIDVMTMVDKLKTILTSESIQFEESALSELAYLADGSLRDALSLTEQAIAYSESKLTLQSVLSMVGAPLKDKIIALLRAVVDENPTKLFEEMASLAQQSLSWSRVAQDLLLVLHNIALAGQLPSYQDPRFNHEGFKSLVKDIKPEVVQIYYQMVLNGRRDLPWAVDEKSGVEMILLRMLAFKGRPLPVSKPREGVGAQSNMPQSRPVESMAPMAPAVRAARPAEPYQQMNQGSRQPPNRLQNFQAQNPSGQNSPVQSPPVQSQQPTDIQDKWHQLIGKLSLKGISKIVAEHCVVQKWTSDALDLVLDEVQSPLLSEDRRKMIQDAICSQLGPIRLNITIVAKTTQDTLAVKRHKEREAVQVQAQNSIEQDENVKALISSFGAVVESITTKTDG